MHALLLVISLGASLYATHCSSCHGANLEGSVNAPPLRKASAAEVDFWVGTGRMPASLPNVEQLRSPPRFTPQQTAAVVEYVVSKSGGSRAMPRVDNTGNLSRGRALFAANCSACHGAVAQGGAVGYGWIAPSLRDATVTQVAEAVRIGPGVMPRFDPTTLSDRDLNDIVAYVAHLRLIGGVWQRGGFALGNDGPVAEGFVGWIFGLGVLLIVIRLIGTNR